MKKDPRPKAQRLLDGKKRKNAGKIRGTKTHGEEVRAENRIATSQTETPKPPIPTTQSDPITLHEVSEMAARSERAAAHALVWLAQVAAVAPRNAGPILVSMAGRYCEAVADWAEKCPDEAKAIARKMPDWPALQGRHIAIMRDTEASLDALQLGDEHPVAAAIMPKRKLDPKTGRLKKTKGIDLAKGANRQAAMIFDAITVSRKTFSQDFEQCASGKTRMPQWRIDAELLDPLSPSTKEDWFSVGWAGCDESDLIPTMLGSDEKPLGYYRRFHNSAPQRGETNTSPSEANVRDGTMSRVRKAFFAMVHAGS